MSSATIDVQGEELMATVLRAVLGIVVGTVVAFALVVAVEGFSAVVHPLPADFGHTQEEMCEHVRRYPAWVLAMALPAWVGTAFVGTWLAGRLGNRASAYVVGLLLVAAVAFNVWMLPYPMWFKIGCLVGIPLAVVLGILGSRRGGQAAVVAV